MKNSRRAFLRATGIAPAAAFSGLAAPSTRAASVPTASARATPELGELRLAHFAPLVGERFTFEREVFRNVQARLVSAAPLTHAGDGERSFRVLFEAMDGGLLPQGSWRISHPALGSQVVFVSPNDAQGRIVEAIFNRL